MVEGGRQPKRPVLIPFLHLQNAIRTQLDGFQHSLRFATLDDAADDRLPFKWSGLHSSLALASRTVSSDRLVGAQQNRCRQRDDLADEALKYDALGSPRARVAA